MMEIAKKRGIYLAYEIAARLLYRATSALALLVLLLAASVQAQSVKLERGWQFLADKEGTLKANELGNAQGWRDVRVGLSWNAQFEDLRDYMGVAWYRTSFEVPQLKDGRRALLRFGAVDYFSEVFVNGKSVGTNEGGYTPFVFDVTDVTKPGANELVVRVIDPPMDEKEGQRRFPEMLYKEIPHGKQNWYVQTGGIWQPVTLKICPRDCIEQVKVTSSLDGTVKVAVRLGNRGRFAEPDVTEVIVRNARGEVEFQDSRSELPLEPTTFQGRVKSPQLWSPDRPTLYTVEVRNVNDSYIDRFGFRSFEARDGKLYLNGQPYYMIAALDQDFYPETIYTPPSEEYVRDMMLKGKRLGLNMLRHHIKVPDPIYLKVADEVGLLIWYEIPSWNDFNHFSPKAAERGEKLYAAMLERDWNHPSVVIQGIINESWGADLKQAEQRRWLRAAFERAKRLVAPTGRLVTDNSACCENFHIKSDLDDFHQYFSIPDNHERWDKWVADFAARPKWSFSQHGDAERTGQEPLIVSEFGNWGLPKLPKELPWWFPRDFGGREVTRPAGLFDRFKTFQFGRLFRDYDQLAEETQWHQFKSLKHEIEEIRRHASIQGYVITEFTDINWEVNGLMDMWRNPKVYAAELARLQQPDLVMARTNKRNYTSGEQIQFKVLFSHYSDWNMNGAKLLWRTESGKSQSRQVINKEITRAGVETLARMSLSAPEVERPRRERILLEARGADDKLIAENYAEVFIFPKPAPMRNTTVVFYDPAKSSTRLAQALTTAGYKVLTDGSNFDSKALIIATLLDGQVERHLRNGGRAIVLANSKDALPANGPFKATPRAGSDRDGNWVTNFNWIRADAAPFSEVAFTKVLGFEHARTVPHYIIEGVRGEDYADVLSGIFYGWLNNNAALAMQMRVGEGKVFATTFRFDEYGTDPYATHLLDAIIRYASGQNFAPRLRMQ